MNLQELTMKWQEQHVAIQQHMELNQKLAAEISKMKVFHLFASMRSIKILTLIVGLLWVMFIDGLLVATYSYASPYFFWSAFLQSLLTKVAIGVYLYQLVLVYQTDISETVVQTQQRIAKLTLSTLWVTRILFLQLPLWTTFWWTEAFINEISPIAQSLLFTFVILFTALALWLFINIRMNNSEKPWFRWIFRGREWEPLVKANNLLTELNANL